VFSKIFVENELMDSPTTRSILKRFSSITPRAIERVDDVFGVVKKPYLQKREDLSLFIGKKRGTLLKEAPEAYGLAGEPHYYFIHAYNCIYECEYCYLQGYFNSPDIVLFINHDEIGAEIERTYNRHREVTDSSKKVWFHAGEFSDSLALSHLSGEIPFYFNLFKNLPSAMLELRTKSVNIRELKKQTPLENVITSFSLSPENRIRKTDLKTPGLTARLKAMKELQELGFPIAIHLDPVIHEEDFVETYENLMNQVEESLEVEKISYISIGVVRFTSKVFHQVKKNYPDSELLAAEFRSSFDGKVRYPRPFRLWLLGKIKDICLQRGLKEEQIYLCME
jgi:spore photoproduct lyase